VLALSALWFFGATTFDIKFLVLCFFANLHLFPLLKCFFFLHYLGSPLIDVLVYVMSLMSTLTRLLCLLILDASYLVGFV